MEQIYFVLTEQCNLTCSHCIRDSSPYRTETAEQNLIQKTLIEISKSYPQAMVMLTGGEPTIHRDFETLLTHSLNLGLNVTINSNGTTGFFSESSLNNWKSYNNLSIQISLDGPDSEHDKIRGDGSYRRALKTINTLRNLGFTCSVSCTVTNIKTFDHIEPFIRDLEVLGLAHISIKRATYAGRASSGVELTTGDWNKKIHELRQGKWNTKIIAFPMYDFALLDAIDEASLKKIDLPSSVKNCGAGTSKIYIYPNGDVCSCTCFKSLPMGNIYKTTLPNILLNRLKISVTDPTCVQCRYFQLCQGGCLGSGYQHTGVLGHPDPRCPRHQKSESTPSQKIEAKCI